MRLLLYIELRQFVNLIRLTLRSPKRLIPALLVTLWGLCYLIPTVVYRSSAPKVYMPGDLPINVTLKIVETGLFLLLALIALYMIQRSVSQSLIIYGLAEVDFLFPTPISRWRFIALKLAKFYIRIGLYLAFIIVVMSPTLLALSSTWYNSLITAAWLALMLYAVLLINVCTAINLVAAYGRSALGAWTRTLVRALTYGFVVLAGVTVYAAYARTENWAAGITSLFKHPVLTTLMFPAAWTADLATVPLRGWEPRLTWRLVLLAVLALVSFVVVLLRKENPYEPSLAISVRTGTLRKAIRSGDFGKVRAEVWKKRGANMRRTAIPPFGRGAMAVFWKNLTVATRAWRGTLIAIFVLIPGLAALGRLLVTDPGTLAVAQYSILPIMLYLLWLVSVFMLHNLRGELKQVNILKPMPISSWRLMVAETAPAGLLILVYVWHIIGSAVLLLGLPPSRLFIFTALALPFVSYGCICSQVVAVVVYPNWEDFSQKWIGGMLGMALFVASMGPPIAVGALLWFLRVPLLIAVPVVICISLAIAAGGIGGGALAYNKFDPTSE